MFKAGFTLPLVLGSLFLGVVAISATGLWHLKSTPVIPSKEKNQQEESIIVEAVRVESTKSAELGTSPTAKAKVTLPEPPTTGTVPVTETKPAEPATGAITITIYDVDGGKSIENSDFHFNIFSNNPKVRHETKGVTTWKIDNLLPGRYSAEVYFPTNSYQARTYSCDNCENPSFTSDTKRSSYDFDIKPGSSPQMRIGYARGSGPGISQTQSANSNHTDTTAPTTNIYYPGNGGTISYKLDGKVCVIQTAPTDDSSGSEVEIQFQFDTGSWSSWKSGQGYLCADSLPNGAHTMQYHSRDKAGNTEAVRTLSFTVSIPGN